MNQNVDPVYLLFNGVNSQFTGQDFLTGEPVSHYEGAAQILSTIPIGRAARLGEVGLESIERVVVKDAAKEGEKSIVVGEGMYRVKPAARSVGAKWYRAWSKNFPEGRLMTDAELSAAKVRNARWLNSKIRQGYKIYDIGIDPSRATRSPFYELEKIILKQRGYPVTKLP